MQLFKMMPEPLMEYLRKAVLNKKDEQKRF